MPKGISKKLTTDQEQFICENYLNFPVKELARRFNCGQTAIRNRFKKFNLIIPAEIAIQRKLDSYFKKGHISHNKGKKQTEYMSAEMIEKTKKSRFQKGINIYNQQPVGTEIVTRDGFLKVKIKQPNIWIHKNRLIYENHHQIKLKPTDIIRFVDGNKRNFDINNLRKITMEENMLRNSHANFPEEIIPTLVLINQIKKTINNAKQS